MATRFETLKDQFAAASGEARHELIHAELVNAKGETETNVPSDIFVGIDFESGDLLIYDNVGDRGRISLPGSVLASLDKITDELNASG